MSTGIIDQITLECLMNRHTYNKIMTSKAIVTKKNQEREFYQNRILHLCGQLMANEPPEGLMQDVTYAFDNYVKTCIRYFKIMDESDIIQKDYNGAPNPTHNEVSDESDENNEDDDYGEDNEDNEDNEDDEYGDDEDGYDKNDEEEELEGQENDDEDDDEDDDVSDEEIKQHIVGHKEEPQEIVTGHKSRYFNEDALCAIISEDEDDSEENPSPNTKRKEEPAIKASPLPIKGTLDMFMRGKPAGQPPAPRSVSAKDIVPKVKDINLENPELMNKGIRRKDR